MARGKLFISETLVVILLAMCVDRGLGHPASYRDPSPNQPVEMTTTPKRVKDVFQLNKQVMPIPQNDSKKGQPHKSHLVDKLKNNDMAYEPVTYKVKSPKAGDNKASRQNEDDDDDDDGGEYDGAADYAGCKKKDQDEPQEKKSMPMMIIRGFDVMAMDVPVPSGKECKKPSDNKPKTPNDRQQDIDDQTNYPDYDETQFQSTTCKAPNRDQTTYRNGYNNQYQTPSTPQNVCKFKGEMLKDLKDRDSGEPRDSKDPTDKLRASSWGEWSPCSKTCGEGVQTRSRTRVSGSADAQYRPCHLADCRADPRLHEAPRAPALQYRQPMKM